MNPLKRLLSLTFVGLGLTTACIDVPEVEPAPPSTSQPDGNPPPPPPQAPPADTTRPTLLALVPGSGSTNVATGSRFILSFSEPMEVGTVRVDVSPTVTFGAPAWASNNTQLTLQPVAPLAENTTYTVVVDGKDVAGNMLDGTRMGQFTTTGPAPDTTAPTVLGTTPESAAIGVARSAAIQVFFSEPMDRASVEAAFAITAPSGANAGTFTWSATGTELTFKPSADFLYETDVSWRILTTAQDLAGNRLQSTTLNTFRVIRQRFAKVSFDHGSSGSLAAPSYFRMSAIYNFEIVGDSFDNNSYRLFLGFKLDSLPAELTRINQAMLKWNVSGSAGTPFSKFGKLMLESVFIGDSIALSNTESTNPLAQGQYHTTPLADPLFVSSDVVSSDGLFDVTQFVSNDWAERANRNTRSQFRLRFEKESNGDSIRDAVFSDAEVDPVLAELEVTYEVP